MGAYTPGYDPNFKKVKKNKRPPVAQGLVKYNLYMLLLHLAKCHHELWSVEKPNLVASNSEMLRWIKNNSVEVNFEVATDPTEWIDYPIVSVVIHPKSVKRRTTLWYKPVSELVGTKLLLPDYPPNPDAENFYGTQTDTTS